MAMEKILQEHFQIVAYPHRFNGLNVSSLFSFLIKKAAEVCNSYSSDIFYDLKELEKDFASEESVLFTRNSYTTVLGFRDCGVDHATWICEKLRHPSVYGNLAKNYKEMYFIRAKKDEDSKEWFTLTLYKVDVEEVEDLARIILDGRDAK